MNIKVNMITAVCIAPDGFMGGLSHGTGGQSDTTYWNLFFKEYG